MSDQHLQVPKRLFMLNKVYDSSNLNDSSDKQFRRFISLTGFGSGQSGAWYPTLIIARCQSLPSAGTIGGIYTGASGGGTAIVNSYAWPSSGSTEIVLPIYATNFPDPWTGGQTTLLSGTPYLYMNTPSSSSALVSIWIFGFETNDPY